MSTDDVIRRGRRAAGQFLLFVLLWVVVAGLEPSSLIIGIPTIGLATWVSLKLGERHAPQQHSGLRLLGLLRFLPFFAIESLRGGIDVAARVMRPRLRIDPGFHRYPLRLKDTTAQVLFVDSISLLPGTLSADLRDGVIDVHALDIGADLEPELQRLEGLVARVFGERLTESPT
jgi:multicomponent Na+:H+ antiporter subunit E